MDAPAKSTYLSIGCLIDALNATRTTLVVPTWGYKDPKTGKLGGMLGDLIDRRAHLGGSPMFFIEPRVSLCDYVSMTFFVAAAFVFRQPPLSYTDNIYYLPLSTTVWICSVLLVILSTIIIYITYRYSWYRQQKWTFSTFLLFSISIVCQMGSEIYSKRLPSRISTVNSMVFFREK